MSIHDVLNARHQPTVAIGARPPGSLDLARSLKERRCPLCGNSSFWEGVVFGVVQQNSECLLWITDPIRDLQSDVSNQWRLKKVLKWGILKMAPHGVPMGEADHFGFSLQRPRSLCVNNIVLVKLVRLQKNLS